MDYVLRLQALDGYKSKFSNVFTDNDRFTRVLCIHHTGKRGDNPHYHFAFTCDYKKDALRKYFKKYFDLATGNRHLSLKDWDGDRKACSYMFHEGTEPVINKGFSEREIEDFKIINETIKNEIKKNAPAKIVEEATIYFKGKDPGHKDIFKYILCRLRSNGDWLPNKYQMDRWIFRIQANLKSDHEWYDYISRVYELWYGGKF